MNNKKTTKRALLSSVMAIVLCLAMLIGTTFAWFTDSASTAVNKIQAGTLEIELQYAIAWDERTGEPTDWANAEGQMLSFRKAAGASENEAILWEPGCTYVLPELRIVNKGNLALKYTMTISGIAGDAELNEAIEWEYAQYSTVNGAYEAALGGSLSSGDSISGAIIPGENNNATDPIVIKGHMKESAGNQYQGKSIDGIAITVVATQDTVEYDSFNNTYDQNAEYPNVVTVTSDSIPASYSSNTTYCFAPGEYGEFSAYLRSAENVTFTALPGATFTKVTIGYHAGQDTSLAAKTNSTLTVKGFTVTGLLYIGAADQKVVVEDNTAGQITVKTNVITGMDIQVLNNNLTGGDTTKAPQGYGVYIVPNMTDYNLTVKGNTFTGIQSHAISVQGNGDGSAVTAAKSITVTGNTFTSYGLNNRDNRAAFKIWEDTVLAPNGTDPINEEAAALAASVKTNNTFSGDLGDNCVVADFYGKAVAFN